jgi:hypothetical protein
VPDAPLPRCRFRVPSGIPQLRLHDLHQAELRIAIRNCESHGLLGAPSVDVCAAQVTTLGNAPSKSDEDTSEPFARNAGNAALDTSFESVGFPGGTAPVGNTFTQVSLPADEVRNMSYFRRMISIHCRIIVFSSAFIVVSPAFTVVSPTFTVVSSTVTVVSSTCIAESPAFTAVSSAFTVVSSAFTVV